MRRRDFLRNVVAGAATTLVVTRLDAQTGAPAQGTTSNLFDMDQAAAKTTRRPPKTGARASLTVDERDALEHQIRCQCGCTLDVYTCRTTDFSCQVSPAMHRDVISLVEGGYSATEILGAFVGTYGERALMSPTRSGFNWAGYLMPFAALGGGAALLVYALRGMRHRSAASSPIPLVPRATLGSDDELARLDAAVRRDV